MPWNRVSEQPFDRLSDRATGRGRSSSIPRLALIFLLLIGLALELPYSSVSVPDHVWLSGIYDDADCDHLILIISGDSLTAEPPLPLLGSLSLVGSAPSGTLPPLLVSPASLPSSPRSPPLA